MVVQHSRLTERLSDLIDRIGYVTKAMKENLNLLKISHNDLALALRDLIRQANDDFVTKWSDHFPPVAGDLSAKVVN